MSEQLKQVTHVENIRYDKKREELVIIDQTLLPNEERFITLTTAEEMYDAIKLLRVRPSESVRPIPFTVWPAPSRRRPPRVS